MNAQRLVDVGGRRLNIFCTGAGTPTVILDAGLGSATSAWRFVQRPIAGRTRVCSYDRAGMGFSDPTSSARDANAVIDDEHRLLTGAGIVPPYVLVGHSIAGLYDLLYAERHPRDVVGLVLVDPSTEYDDALLRRFVPPRTYAREEQTQDATYRACVAHVQDCSIANVTLLERSLKAKGCPKADPPECAVSADVRRHEFERPMFFEDVFLELHAIAKGSTSEARAARRSLGAMPLIVLSAGDPEPDPTLTSSQVHAMWLAELRLQERVAAQSSHGVEFVVAGSGHNIQLERPTAVISAVGEVVDQARAKSAKSPAFSVR